MSSARGRHSALSRMFVANANVRGKEYKHPRKLKTGKVWLCAGRVKATGNSPPVASVSERPPPQLKEIPCHSCFGPSWESRRSAGPKISGAVSLLSGNAS